MLLAAKVIACACADLLENPEELQKAKRELDKRVEGHSYRSAIPKTAKPRAIGKL
jgi:aminobenzoyl-glutamate utilization protein B